MRQLAHLADGVATEPAGYRVWRSVSVGAMSDVDPDTPAPVVGLSSPLPLKVEPDGSVIASPSFLGVIFPARIQLGNCRSVVELV